MFSDVKIDEFKINPKKNIESLEWVVEYNSNFIFAPKYYIVADGFKSTNELKLNSEVKWESSIENTYDVGPGNNILGVNHNLDFNREILGLKLSASGNRGVCCAIISGEFSSCITNDAYLTMLLLNTNTSGYIWYGYSNPNANDVSSNFLEAEFLFSELDKEFISSNRNFGDSYAYVKKDKTMDSINPVGKNIRLSQWYATKENANVHYNDCKVEFLLGKEIQNKFLILDDNGVEKSSFSNTQTINIQVHGLTQNTFEICVKEVGKTCSWKTISISDWKYENSIWKGKFAPGHELNKPGRFSIQYRSNNFVSEEKIINVVEDKCNGTLCWKKEGLTFESIRDCPTNEDFRNSLKSPSFYSSSENLEWGNVCSVEHRTETDNNCDSWVCKRYIEPSPPGCGGYDHSRCMGPTDVWWYDSCGNPQNFWYSCEGKGGCLNGRCACDLNPDKGKHICAWSQANFDKYVGCVGDHMAWSIRTNLCPQGCATPGMENNQHCQ